MASTATSDILKYMRENPKGITQKEATELFGTTRLSAIIYQLRHVYGLNIETVNESCVTRYSRKAPYGRYVLHESVVE